MKATSLSPFVILVPRMEMSHFSSSGTCLLELMVALILSSVIFLSTLPLVRTALGIERTTSHKLRLRAQAQFIETLFRQSHARSQGLYILPGIVVHPPGRLAYHDNSPHEIHSSTASSPASDSNPVSFLEISPQFLLRVANCTGCPSHGGTVRLSARLENEDLSAEMRETILSSKTWVGFSIDGAVSLSGQITGQMKSASDGRRYEIDGTFSPLKKSVFPPLRPLRDSNSPEIEDHEILNSLCVILPVIDSYTYYVDSDRVLRRLSHATSETQPATRNVERLSAEWISDSLASITISLKHPVDDEVFTHSFLIATPSNIGQTHLDLILP